MTIYGDDPVKFDPGKQPSVRFALTDEAKAAGLPLPERKHEGDAGFDLRAFAVTQNSGYPWMIHTGIKAAIPAGWCGLIRERSSAGTDGLHVVAGLIDSSYRGEIVIVATQIPPGLYGWNPETMTYPRIAQLLIVPVWQGDVECVDNLDETERGAGGFGSTGQG